jgi:hypothetical protein
MLLSFVLPCLQAYAPRIGQSIRATMSIFVSPRRSREHEDSELISQILRVLRAFVVTPLLFAMGPQRAVRDVLGDRRERHGAGAKRFQRRYCELR